jgi:hypothetical protein
MRGGLSIILVIKFGKLRVEAEVTNEQVDLQSDSGSRHTTHRINSPSITITLDSVDIQVQISFKAKQFQGLIDPPKSLA